MQLSFSLRDYLKKDFRHGVLCSKVIKFFIDNKNLNYFIIKNLKKNVDFINLKNKQRHF